MRKLLQPSEKYIHLQSTATHQTLLLRYLATLLRHPLKFLYLIQQITVSLSQLPSNLNYSLLLQNTRSHSLSQIPLTATPNSPPTLTSCQFSTLADSLCLKLSLPLQQPTQLPQLLLSIEFPCYNLDLYQTIDSSIELLNISHRLRDEEASHLVLFHVGMVAKHRSRWQQAEETLKPLIKTNLREEVLLNLADCAVDCEGKLRYLSMLGDGEVTACELFRKCRHVVGVLGARLRLHSLMSCATYLNLVTFLLNQVGCSMADSILPILTNLLQICRNRKLLKPIKVQSPQNHQLLCSSLTLLLDSIRMCALSFSPSYVQTFAEFLMQHICRDDIGIIRKPLLELQHSFLKQEGKAMRVSFGQWLAVVGYLDEERRAAGGGVNSGVSTNGSNGNQRGSNSNSSGAGKDKSCREEMMAIQEDMRGVVLAAMRGEPMRQFINDLSECFVRQVLAPEVNIRLVHRLLELVSSICLTFSQHNRDIKPDLPTSLLPLSKPLKMLICRLLQLRIKPQSIFQQAWDIYAQYHCTVDGLLQQTLLDVVVSLLNKHMLHTPSPCHLPYLCILGSSLSSFPGLSHLYPQFCSSLIQVLLELLPNSIYPSEIYSLIEKVIVFRPEVLQGMLTPILKWLTNPYTEEEDRWRQFVEQLAVRVGGEKGEKGVVRAVEWLLEVGVQGTREEAEGGVGFGVKRKKQDKRKYSQQHYKCQQQRLIRSLHILRRFLRYLPNLPLPLLQDTCSSLISDLHSSPSLRLLNLLFHKYYLISQYLCPRTQLSCQYFTLFQLSYPPVTYSCLVLIAANRKLVTARRTHFMALLTQVESPWRNVQELALLLLGYFVEPEEEEGEGEEVLVGFIDRLVSSEEVYRKLIALSVIYHLCRRPNCQHILSQLPLSHILQSDSTIKQLQMVVYYVVNLCQQLTNPTSKSEYFLTKQDEEKIQQVLVLEDRIDMIVEREFQKDTEEFLKSEMVLPRKTENLAVVEEEMEEGAVMGEGASDGVGEEDREPGREEVRGFDELEIEGIIDSPTVSNTKQPQPAPQQQQQPAVCRPPIKQIQIHINTPKTNTLKKQHKQPKQSTNKVYTTPRQSNSSNGSKRGCKTPKQFSTGPPAKTSPVVEVQSKHQKFKISLSCLKDKWKQGLVNIGRRRSSGGGFSGFGKKKNS